MAKSFTSLAAAAALLFSSAEAVMPAARGDGYPVVAPPPAVVSPTATVTVTMTDAPLAPLYPSTLLTTFYAAPVPTDVSVPPPAPGLTTTTTLVLAAPMPPDASTFPVLDLSVDANGNLVTLIPSMPTGAVSPIAPPSAMTTTMTTIELGAPFPSSASTFPELNLTVDGSGDLVTLPFPTSTDATYPTAPPSAETSTTAPAAASPTTHVTKCQRANQRRRAHGQHKRRHSE